MKKNLLLGIMCLYVGLSGCADKRKYHDTIKSGIASDNSEMVKEILLFQKELNEEFKNPETSPLPDRYRKDFEGLDFFQPDTSFRVIASLERTVDAIPFMMPTTTDRLSEEVVFGLVNFTIKGKNYSLEVYQNLELMETAEYEDYLFLPFLDNTNGEETYAGGRYLDLAIPEGNSIILDFNRAYNPYCAYNKKYSCPIVPKRNNLDTKIKAGVKSFKHKSNK
ncbi:DUF1684 domain-containing protein [Eudoraea sp.]|uniref:DUF1684 domain-containing protein n=1 Tax=Eudoraea sp. TaxID=1979955 RepID=UPI003C72CA6E